jgi:hypothetical protein
MKHFSAILLLFVCLFSTPQLFAQTATNNTIGKPTKTKKAILASISLPNPSAKQARKKTKI